MALPHALSVFGLLCLTSILQADEYLDRTFGIRRVASGCAFTEGPVVDAQGVLYFSDGPRDRIMRRKPGGELEVFQQPCGAANGLLFDLEGNLLLCQSARPGGARALARLPLNTAAPQLETLTQSFDHAPYIAPNDLAIDGDGNIYFTDPYYDGEKSQPHSGVYRYAPSGHVERLLDDLEKPNGILLTADDHHLYVSDRGTQKLHRYRITPEKRLVHERVVYDFSPDRGIDGMWLDVEGNIYGAAGAGNTTGLFILSPAGKLLQHQPLSEFATNVTFGGDDMRDLYVTATSSVYHLRSRIPGLRHRYQRPRPQAAIRAMLTAQAAAWNRGDLDKFLESYWHHPQLTFSSGGEVRRGFEETKRRYQQRYPDRQAMGKLTFGELEISLVAPDVALVLGRWHLTRDSPIGGAFTLVIRRMNGLWKIVHDHTSTDAS